MAIAYVNSANPIVNGSGTDVAFDATSLTAGNLIAVEIRWSGSGITITSITDTAGNTYVQAGTDIDTVALGAHVALWYAQNTAGNGSNIVTIHFSGGGGSGVYVTNAQYSGLATSNALDTTDRAAATSTSVTSAGFTTTTANQLIVSVVGVEGGSGSTLTPSGTSGSYTTRSMSNVGVDVAGIADIIVAATQSGKTATWTSTASDSIAILVATFKDATVAETITVDKWYAKIPDIARRKFGVVASGTIGIKS